MEQAREILHADSIKETVNRALLEVVRARARRREADALAEMEGLELDDDEVMEGAWQD